jgi:hypothetical protein
VFRRFNMDEAAKVLAEINGVPSSILLSDDELEQAKAAEQQQAELAAVLQAAPVAASAAKDLAQAQSLAASVPNQMVPGLGL